MDLLLESNLPQVAEELGKLARDVDKASEAGVKAATDHVRAAAEKNIAKIEDAAIPQSSTGRQLWEHSGDLLSGLTEDFPTSDSGVVDIQGNAAEYAQSRHQLGEASSDDWGEGRLPENPAGGVVRDNPFFKDAVTETEPDLTAIFETDFSQKLNL